MVEEPAMKAPGNYHETEIKLAIASAQEGKARLTRAGFRLAKRRILEDNLIFDTAGASLREQGALLRLRKAGSRGMVTFKGPAIAGRHKSREEIETGVADADAVAGILERLGFRPTFRYQKYRAEYARPGESGVAMLDETPIGCFLELEGLPEWIDRAAQALGFTEADYNTASYGRLYLESCQRLGIEPGEMVFHSR